MFESPRARCERPGRWGLAADLRRSATHAPRAPLITFRGIEDLAAFRRRRQVEAVIPHLLDSLWRRGDVSQHYGFMDKPNVFRGLTDMGGHLCPQAQDVDFRRDVPALKVPVYLIEAGHELGAQALPAEEFASMLQVPSLNVVVFENSGLVPQFEEATRFHRYLVDVVLAETAGTQS